MLDSKPSRGRRFLGLLIFRLLPAFLILGTFWYGVRVAQAVVQRVGELVHLDQRGVAYVETATAIAPTLVTHTPANTDVPTLTPTSQSTATYTPTMTESATVVESPTPTLTASITETLVPTVTMTNTAIPLPTETDVPSLTSTPTPVAVAQIFATNTLRPSPDVSVLTTNTPISTSTSTLTATATVSPVPTATATYTPSVTPTGTPRSLPTLLQPANPAEDLVMSTAIPPRADRLSHQGYDIVNILLLGGDDELTDDNFARTDTMIVLSINRSTNTVAMLSLPRDLFVYIPTGTMQRLNVAYSIGESYRWTDGGFGLLAQTLLYNFGITVHYFGRVNFSGFEQIIDTVGGVDVAVDCAIRDYHIIDNPNLDAERVEDNYELRTLPVGMHHLNGAEALWYARSRKNSDDFDRGRRQQQILRAVYRTTRDSGQLANLPTLWTQGLEAVETNLEFDDMLGLLPTALSLDANQIESFTMIRGYHTTPWTTLAGDNVQLPEPDPIRQLLEDFITPPTESQISLEGATIAVYNGTDNADWDRVAAERLAWDGLNAISFGPADDTGLVDTILIDHTGQEKGSSLSEIASILNVRPDSIIVEPDPDRFADFEVVLGSNYNSCTFAVLPVEGE